MPNRGELPIPAMRNRNPARSQPANPDADAWAVVAFCAIGGLLSFCLALASVGMTGFPASVAQLAWGG
ncbi:MAG TPA: hypothetical protein VL048_10215 [Xanthobacteraceae bacterium]|jgi:hypothetical protein|nr:hypothetical protein [Xanthobacteraceae bacterium]